MEPERPWPLALKAQPALGRMSSDELSAGKTNPFMSKELFNYVWLINPNPSIPLTIYLYNQVPCSHRAAVCGWWCWRRERKDRKKQKRLQNNPFGGSIQKSKGERFCSTYNSPNAHSAWVPAKQLLLTFKGQRTLALRDFKQKASSGAFAYHSGMLVFTGFMGKGNLKALSPVWKRGCQED